MNPDWYIPPTALVVMLVVDAPSGALKKGSYLLVDQSTGISYSFGFSTSALHARDLLLAGGITLDSLTPKTVPPDTILEGPIVRGY